MRASPPDESVAAGIERLVAEEHDLRTREQAERDDDALASERVRPGSDHLEFLGVALV
jgi:hypothetical protein